MFAGNLRGLKLLGDTPGDTDDVPVRAGGLRIFRAGCYERSRHQQTGVRE